jgi:hypothetical protein
MAAVAGSDCPWRCWNLEFAQETLQDLIIAMLALLKTMGFHGWTEAAARRTSRQAEA